MPGGIIVIGGGGFLLVLAVIVAGVGALLSLKGKRYPAIFMLLFTISVLVLNLPLVRQDFDPGHRKTHDSLVKATLKNAATAQETYFVDNRTYTNKVSSLKGFYQSANVNISASTTATTFVITGAVKEGCKENTGTWTFNSTDGSINGTPCQ